jgi:hypothetical protein
LRKSIFINNNIDENLKIVIIVDNNPSSIEANTYPPTVPNHPIQNIHPNLFPLQAGAELQAVVSAGHPKAQSSSPTLNAQA